MWLIVDVWRYPRPNLNADLAGICSWKSPDGWRCQWNTNCSVNLTQSSMNTPWWRHQMEMFSELLCLVFSLICAWTNGWGNDRNDGDLRRPRAHYDLTVMTFCWDIPDMCQLFYYFNNVKSMLNSMLRNKDFLTWLLISWQLCCQPNRCQVTKSLLINTDLNKEIL